MEQQNDSDWIDEDKIVHIAAMQLTDAVTELQDELTAERLPVEPLVKKKRRRGRRGRGRSQQATPSSETNDQLEDKNEVSEQSVNVSEEEIRVGGSAEIPYAVEQAISILAQKKSQMIPYTLLKMLLLTQQWERAEALIAELKLPGRRDKAYCIYVYELFYFMHNEQAIRIINSIENRERRERFLFMLALLVRKEKWRSQALLLESIQMNADAEKIVEIFNEHAIQQEQMRRAQKSAMFTMLDIQEKDGLSFLAETLIRTQRLEQAQCVIAIMPDSQQKYQILFLLTRFYLKKSRWEQAQSAINEIADMEWRTMALDLIAKRLTSIKGQRQNSGQQEDQEDEEGFLPADTSMQKVKSVPQNMKHTADGQLEKVVSNAQSLEQTEQLIKAIQDVQQRVGALIQLGKTCIALQNWEQAQRLFEAIPIQPQRDQALLLLKQVLSVEREWEWAIRVIQHIKDAGLRDRSFRILSTRLAWVQEWERATWAVNAIRDNRQRWMAIHRLGESLAQAGEHKQLLSQVQQAWRRAETREEAIELLVLVQGLVPLLPAISVELGAAFAWADNFLQEY